MFRYHPWITPSQMLHTPISHLSYISWSHPLYLKSPPSFFHWLHQHYSNWSCCGHPLLCPLHSITTGGIFLKLNSFLVSTYIHCISVLRIKYLTWLTGFSYDLDPAYYSSLCDFPIPTVSDVPNYLWWCKGQKDQLRQKAVCLLIAQANS